MDMQKSVAWITTKSLKEENKVSNFNQISKFIKVKKKRKKKRVRILEVIMTNKDKSKDFSFQANTKVMKSWKEPRTHTDMCLDYCLCVMDMHTQRNLGNVSIRLWETQWIICHDDSYLQAYTWKTEAGGSGVKFSPGDWLYNVCG